MQHDGLFDIVDIRFDGIEGSSQPVIVQLFRIDVLADIEPKEKNRLLKQIIDTIFYKRLGDDIEVEVRFL